MARLFFLGLNLIFLIPYSFAAVTIIGKEDAALCYQSAELGYTGYSQTQACLRALEDPFLNSRDRSGTHINLGIIFNNLFLPDKALASFNKAKFFIDFNPEIFLNSGNSYFIKMEFWTAIEYYDKSINSGIKDKSVVFYNKGLAYEMLKDLSAAVSNYKKALIIKPDAVYLEKKRKLITSGHWED